ncbi:LacI family transcriptional regulator [Chitinophaga agrisoli]|uniref:LacI family transcriptional regulator n=1 Tax=Chitinophaga agrisoli TaxID=2607653 RepID=A0A5B2VVP3_9BACT|nr:substrate-binding domain-containing protein [Chitinophaga agrisoli]KAA2242750.1 LacI family transcriptional regulator [Chitinophaga agrisoli]
MKKKIALKDIAQHVGVSTALVSYVLNGRAEEKRVGKEIAEKIREAADTLNYRPNQIAKSLKTNRTNTVGLIVADINYRFTSGVTRAIEAEAGKNNYTVILGSSDEDHSKFAELVNVLVNRQVDGLILVPVEKSESQIEWLKKHEIPFVLIDRNFPGIQANHIAVDNFRTAYQCTQHLIKTGHKKIGFINYKTTLYHLRERDRGYFQALEDHGLKNNSKFKKEIREKHVQEDVLRSVQELVAQGCDGIFFATDIIAINGLKYINGMQLRVPEDLAIVSFDEAEAFELFYCPITHARQPLEEIGKIAVNTLMDIINHNQVNRQIYLEAGFVLGRSCGE